MKKLFVTTFIIATMLTGITAASASAISGNPAFDGYNGWAHDAFLSGDN